MFIERRYEGEDWRQDTPHPQHIVIDYRAMMNMVTTGTIVEPIVGPEYRTRWWVNRLPRKWRWWLIDVWAMGYKWWHWLVVRRA